MSDNSTTTPFLHNTALLLMPNLITVTCVFDKNDYKGKDYKFVCPKEMASRMGYDDPLVVSTNAGHNLRIAYFRDADDELEIDPDSDIMYSFIVQPIRMGDFRGLYYDHQQWMDLLIRKQRVARRAQAVQALGIDPQTLGLPTNDEAND